MGNQWPIADSVGQDQTAQNVQFDLISMLSVTEVPPFPVGLKV